MIYLITTNEIGRNSHCYVKAKEDTIEELSTSGGFKRFMYEPYTDVDKKYVGESKVLTLSQFINWLRANVF